jgi:hypothetical protein
VLPVDKLIRRWILFQKSFAAQDQELFCWGTYGTGSIDTSLDPIEEETVDELYQIWLEDYDFYAGNSAQARRFAAISQR